MDISVSSTTRNSETLPGTHSTIPVESTTIPDSPESVQSPPPISIISAAAFSTVLRQPGSVPFVLRTTPPSASANSADSTEPAPDLSGIPQDYQDFADVFSKERAGKLAEHREYNLKIELLDKEAPPTGPIYSLSPPELQVLRDFIDENLKSGFITPSNSP